VSFSAVLQVVIGLSFLFAFLSLVASGASELISAAFKLRARTLEKGIANLLEHPADAEAMYRHPLIQSLYRGRRLPSYIPRGKFALALLDTRVKVAINATKEQLPAVTTAIADLPDGQVKESLDLLWRDARNDVDKFRRNVEDWFDDAMERVSGWYRRRTQSILLVLGALIAVGLNVNAITVTQRLWTDPALRTAVVEQAQRTAPVPAGDETAGTDALQNVQSGLETIDALSLPIGWATPTRPSTWYSAAAGWVLTTLAISLGAPFWFDLLGRVARLRSTGVRPPTSLPPSAEAESSAGPSAA
jgi:hypothetical protein